MRNVSLNIDLAEYKPQIVEMKQGDDTVLKVTVDNNSTPVTLADYDIILNIVRPNNTAILQGDNMTTAGNVLTIELNRHAVAHTGNVQFELQFYKNSKIISSYVFGAFVVPALIIGIPDIVAETISKDLYEAVLYALQVRQELTRQTEDSRELYEALSTAIVDINEKVTAAFSAKTAAETAKTAAEAAKQSAENSAANAAQSATNAAGSASAAATAKTAAEAAKQSAESARDSAALSETNAAKSEESAANSAKAAEQAASGAVGAVNSAGATQVERVENAGNRAVDDVNAVADAKKAEIEQLDLVEEVNQVSEAISDLEGFVLGTANLKSWKEVQELVRAGLAPKILKVGDQLECQRDGVKLTWDIIGLDCDTPVNPGLTHSMTLQLHDGWKSLQFDATEALYYCETELAAGTYNFTLLAGYDTTYGGGKTYSFTLANAVPAGGVIMFPWGYQKQAAETKISTYASRESTTVLESVSVTEGANGTSLGTADGKSANMNHVHRIRYGSNKYSTSAMRQLLNSDAAAGKVWTPQTIFDRPPTWAATQNGFLSGLDPDFLAVVADVKKRTALNTITDGGGYEDTVEKFFLLSRSEVYAGLENSVNEGNPYPYYSDFSDLSAAGSGEDGNRIKYMDGVAKYWWLRSPLASNASIVRYVNPSGTLDGYHAHSAYACAPACTIA